MGETRGGEGEADQKRIREGGETSCFEPSASISQGGREIILEPSRVEGGCQLCFQTFYWEILRPRKAGVQVDGARDDPEEGELPSLLLLFQPSIH